MHKSRLQYITILGNSARFAYTYGFDCFCPSVCVCVCVAIVGTGHNLAKIKNK